ncbi:MAG TPA: 30S ribosomal protein S19 [Phycisphaerales bacterium]|jgi:small subunit ribosomal protein S19|nr:30S ribosomal protein S19 [Phycisphaerales bacterium]
MGRSLKKGPFVDERLYRRVEKLNQTGKREGLKTWSRACTIVPEFVGHTFKVHNGRQFLDVFVTEDMVGHKLGEFSISRTFRGHTNKKEGIEGGAAPAAAPAKG